MFKLVQRAYKGKGEGSFLAYLGPSNNAGRSITHDLKFISLTRFSSWPFIRP